MTTGCRPMLTYAPTSEQPPLDRALDDLPDYEAALMRSFSDASFVDKLMGFLTLEENKGKDKFHSKYFALFKVGHSHHTTPGLFSSLAVY